MGWCCSTVSASRLAPAMSARIRKIWHRNPARSSSSVGNALRFQSWAQCFWMLLTFHNWSRIYHRRDGSTFFWSFKWKQIAAFCRVQSAVTQIQMPYLSIFCVMPWQRVVRVEHQVNVQQWTGLGELHSYLQLCRFVVVALVLRRLRIYNVRLD